MVLAANKCFGNQVFVDESKFIMEAKDLPAKSEIFLPCTYCDKFNNCK